MSRACAFHPSGDYVAIGFGGRVGRGKQKDDGVLRIYSYPKEHSSSMTKLCEMKDAKQWISDVKFSPDGTILAVGSHDDIIFYYSVTITKGANPVSLQLTGKFSKHNSFFYHMIPLQMVRAACIVLLSVIFNQTQRGHRDGIR